MGVGTVFEDTVNLMVRTSAIPTRFVEYVPNRKITYRHLGGPVRADLSYEITPVPSGTQLTVAIDARLPWYLAPITPLVKGRMARQMDGNFAALKALLAATVHDE